MLCGFVFYLQFNITINKSPIYVFWFLMPNFYISASVKINLEKNISLSRVPVFWYALNQTHWWLSLRVLLEKILPLRIEPRRMADLEIKSNYTVSKVVHVPLWYSETLVMTALITWMQSGSHLPKILLKLHWLQSGTCTTLICGDSNQGIWMQNGTYTTPQK